jgi:hypothetical protein
MAADPPWRLDPLQNIVNINWGGLAVIFGSKDEDAPKQDPSQVQDSSQQGGSS